MRKRLARIRVFDPACGSGNFLVIAYRQMREIERRIIIRLQGGNPLLSPWQRRDRPLVKLELEREMEILEQRQIKSPIDGIVLERTLNVASRPVRPRWVVAVNSASWHQTCWSPGDPSTWVVNMITWKNRHIDQMKPEELRLALEDAADEIIRARNTFGSDQVLTTLLAGFGMGALLTCLVLAVLHRLP